jgi:hypothetical protein
MLYEVCDFVSPMFFIVFDYAGCYRSIFLLKSDINAEVCDLASLKLGEGAAQRYIIVQEIGP